MLIPIVFFFFFFNDTATTEIYTLSLHDALPILEVGLEREDTEHQVEPARHFFYSAAVPGPNLRADIVDNLDRKSTRLNSSHTVISYAVFCLKKKKKKHKLNNMYSNKLKMKKKYK